MLIIYLIMIIRANILSRCLSPHLEMRRPRPKALVKELKAIENNTEPYPQPVQLCNYTLLCHLAPEPWAVEDTKRGDNLSLSLPELLV